MIGKVVFFLSYLFETGEPRKPQCPISASDALAMSVGTVIGVAIAAALIVAGTR